MFLSRINVRAYNLKLWFVLRNLFLCSAKCEVIPLRNGYTDDLCRGS